MQWIRPPNVTIGELQTVAANGSEFEITNDGVNINLGVNITYAFHTLTAYYLLNLS